jgi:hypothetical protein
VRSKRRGSTQEAERAGPWLVENWSLMMMVMLKGGFGLMDAAGSQQVDTA